MDDFPEVHTAGDCTAEGSDLSNDSNVAKDNGGVPSGGIGQNGDIRKDSGFQKEHFGFPSQRSETNASAMHSEKVVCELACLDFILMCLSSGHNFIVFASDY